MGRDRRRRGRRQQLALVHSFLLQDESGRETDRTRPGAGASAILRSIGSYRLRPAQEQELPLLSEIERAADRLFPTGRIPDNDATYPLDRLEEAFRDGQVLVTEVLDPSEISFPSSRAANPRTDGLVGFAISRRDDRFFHLDLVAVHPEHGRHGLGRQLVSAVVEEADRRGLAGVRLTTFADLPWNAPFYASCGFQPIPESELDESLQRILESERRAGMTSRIAMFRPSTRIG